MKTALYIGRFQPFHLGHLSVIKNALKESDRLIIGIGSSQESKTKNNPFTARQRIKMIRSALKEAGISSKRYKIILLKDIVECDKEWVDYVLKKSPKFQIIYTGNPWTIKCFIKVKGIKLKRIKKDIDISSTKVRKLILQAKKWHNLVPKPVAKEILKIKK